MAGRAFIAIEVNATFYRLQSVETFRRWRGRFEIGDIDRKEKQLMRIPIERITTIPGYPPERRAEWHLCLIYRKACLRHAPQNDSEIPARKNNRCRK